MPWKRRSPTFTREQGGTEKELVFSVLSKTLDDCPLGHAILMFLAEADRCTDDLKSNNARVAQENDYRFNKQLTSFMVSVVKIKGEVVGSPKHQVISP